MSATGSARRNGFTLLELLVVLAIMALLAAAIPIALPRLFPGQQLRVTTHQVATQLRDLQTKAVLSGAVQEFVLDADTGANVRIQLVSAAKGSPAPATIVFYPDGSSSGARILLTLGERRSELAVSALTARIRQAQP